MDERKKRKKRQYLKSKIDLLLSNLIENGMSYVLELKHLHELDKLMNLGSMDKLKRSKIKKIYKIKI
jgi:hypothetical protein